MWELTESFHQLTTSIITQLIAFMQVMGNHDPTTTLVALSCFIVYYVLHVVLLRPGRFASLTERLLVWSGYAAVATLAAAVFPHEAAPFLYAIFGLLSAREILYMLGDKLVTKDKVETKDDDVVDCVIEIKGDDVDKVEAEESSTLDD